MGNKGRGEKTKMNKGRREGQGERANNNKEFSYVFVWCLFRSLIGPKSGQNPKKKKHPNLQPHYLKPALLMTSINCFLIWVIIRREDEDKNISQQNWFAWPVGGSEF